MKELDGPLRACGCYCFKSRVRILSSSTYTFMHGPLDQSPLWDNLPLQGGFKRLTLQVLGALTFL